MLAEYRDSVAQRAARFEQEFAAVCSRFALVCDEYMQFELTLARCDDRGAKRLLPFLTQVRLRLASAFYQVASGNAAAGMALLKIVFETALVTGKLADDPDNGSILQTRDSSPHQYQRSFGGMQIISRSLPSSALMQAGAARIGTTLSDAAPACYGLTTGEATPYDVSGAEAACALAILHAACVLLVELRQLAPAAASTATPEGLLPASIRRDFEAEAVCYAADSPAIRELFATAGLWKLP